MGRLDEVVTSSRHEGVGCDRSPLRGNLQGGDPKDTGSALYPRLVAKVARVRDGQVSALSDHRSNRTNRERDILGIWAGDGGLEGGS